MSWRGEGGMVGGGIVVGVVEGEGVVEKRGMVMCGAEGGNIWS